jgi:DNA ligase (NAD+)
MAKEHLESVKSLDTDLLISTIMRLEQTYRDGNPEVSDDVFDHVYLAELERRDPDHPLLNRIGTESDFGNGKVVHPQPMLSTAKAYDMAGVEKFTRRVSSAASKINIAPASIQYRITAKLDGMAARYDGKQLVTRGDGLKGNDITSAIAKGVVMDGPGVGEIVMSNPYFEANLADNFSHPRNVVVGAVGADDLNKETQKALDDGAIRFVNYQNLKAFIFDSQSLLEELEEVHMQLLKESEYPIDGVVIEVLDETIKSDMGANNHHHRWMLAKKIKGEHAVTTVIDIEWTTGRTGRITPTVILEPVHLSGAKISRVTAHHAGNVKKLGIGGGASLRVLRSGEVIPFIDKILQPAKSLNIPTQCPACETEIVWERDFIVCIAEDCISRCLQRLSHYFRTIENVDLFGEKTLEKLISHGHRDLVSIYQLNVSDFESCGFSLKQSVNLVAELLRSRTDAVEDWRWLGALGIPHLGRGSSRRLLKVHALHSLNKLSIEDIEKVDSFGSIVSPSVHSDLQQMWPTIEELTKIGFNLVSSNVPTEGILSGKRIVFTGTMDRPRKEMIEQAIQLGAEVQSSVRSNTDWLVTGSKVGASKLSKAAKNDVEIVPVKDYESRIR